MNVLSMREDGEREGGGGGGGESLRGRERGMCVCACVRAGVCDDDDAVLCECLRTGVCVLSSIARAFLTGLTGVRKG
jgi:hypothetical protein